MELGAGRTDSSSVRSSIVLGSVYHARFSPKEHRFQYPMLTLQLDVGELERGDLNSAIFGFNRRRILSVKANDYLCADDRAAAADQKLSVRVCQLLASHGVSNAPARITLVTMPRLLGYVFNPVSFFLCFDLDNNLIGCVTQVHNTFGEAHIYPLVCTSSALPVEWRFAKAFFVSPFFDSIGEYRVVIEREGDELSIVVELFKGQESGGSCVFTSKLKGRAKVLNSLNILKSLIRYPLILFLTIPRIHMQAIFLLFRAKLVPFVKPKPSSSYTIRSRQGFIHRARLWFLDRMR
jgi:DUF1365 family protein